MITAYIFSASAADDMGLCGDVLSCSGHRQFGSCGEIAWAAKVVSRDHALGSQIGQIAAC